MGSVSIQSNSYQGRVYTFTVSQSGTSTTVNWTLTSSGGSVAYYACSAVDCKINGVSVWSCAQKAWSNKSFPTCTGSVSGSYNIGSYGTFTCSLSGNPYYYTPTTKTGSVTLTAGTTTITFANGGGISYVQINGVNHSLPYSVTGSQGSKVYETAIPATGYHFDHTWNSDSGTYYNATDNWTFISTNRTIYLYGAKNSYTVEHRKWVWNYSTSSWNLQQTNTLSFYYGDTDKIDSSQFTPPTGYKFSSAAWSPDGSTWYTSSPFTVTANIVVHYHYYHAYYTQTLNFYYNKGGAGWVYMTSKTYSAEYGSTFTPTTSGVSTPTGYHWYGWNDNSWTVTGAKSTNGHFYPNTYTVSYDANGGSGAPGNTSFLYESTSYISSTKPTRTGYTFQHWTYNGTNFAPGAAIPVGWGSFKLTAVWKANTYTATLNQNGATTAGTTSQSVTYASTPSSITIPKREFTIDYHRWDGVIRDTVSSLFQGFNNSSGTTQYINSSGNWSRTYDIAGNTTLYASWADAIITLPSPVRTGYTFLGWKCSNGTTYPAGATVAATSNLTFSESWRADSVLVKDNGTWVEGLVWVRENGQWVRGKLYTKKDDEWITK